MLESIFIMLLIVAILLLILAITWESLSICIIDVILWLLLTISIYQLEIPYQYTTGGVAYTATHTIENLWPLSWLFLGITIIMMLQTFVLALEFLKGKEVKVM